MAFLTLGGISVRVLVDSLQEKPTTYSGGRERMRFGNTVSTEANGVRAVGCQIAVLNAAELAALFAACPRGAASSVTSTDIDLNITALVDFQDRHARRQIAGVFYQIVNVEIQETVVV